MRQTGMCPKPLLLLKCSRHCLSNSNNDTIRKEYENYRKDDCNFLLYGYCQGGELLLEKLVNIQFDHGKLITYRQCIEMYDFLQITCIAHQSCSSTNGYKPFRSTLGFTANH